MVSSFLYGDYACMVHLRTRPLSIDAIQYSLRKNNINKKKHFQI